MGPTPSRAGAIRRPCNIGHQRPRIDQAGNSPSRASAPRPVATVDTEPLLRWRRPSCLRRSSRCRRYGVPSSRLRAASDMAIAVASAASAASGLHVMRKAASSRLSPVVAAAAAAEAAAASLAASAAVAGGCMGCVGGLVAPHPAAFESRRSGAGSRCSPSRPRHCWPTPRHWSDAVIAAAAAAAAAAWVTSRSFGTGSGTVGSGMGSGVVTGASAVLSSSLLPHPASPSASAAAPAISKYLILILGSPSNLSRPPAVAGTVRRGRSKRHLVILPVQARSVNEKKPFRWNTCKLYQPRGRRKVCRVPDRGIG